MPLGDFAVRIVLVGLLAFLIAGCPSNGASRSRVDADERRLLVYEDLFAVEVLAPRRAVAVGSWGRLVRTNDGGEWWTIETLEAPRSLLDVGFADASRGWITGEGGLILATEDGGSVWRRQESPTRRNLFALAVIDAERVWAVGEQGTIVRTIDGGQTWTDHSLDEDVILNDVWFLNRRRGWIVGEFGTILRTQDAGASWQKHESIVGAPPDVYLYAVRFDEDQGFAAGLGGTLLLSADGGRTWRRVEAGTRNHLYAIAASDGGLVGVGDQAEIRSFGPHGSARPERRPEASLWLRDVAFRGKEGFAVGAKSQVLHTLDGGRTWSDVSVTRSRAGLALPEEAPR